ncbi:elongation factor 1-beta [Candidatus Woesearchaeota archaeon]|nr:elongation factor 1-beta [Candidatus Woesearchaeota archaeon]
MVSVVATIKVMPESPDTDLKAIEVKAEKCITSFGAALGKTEIHPVAFGLKALHLIIITPEEKGSTESLENDIAKIQGVNSVDVIDVRRAIG